MAMNKNDRAARTNEAARGVAEVRAAVAAAWARRFSVRAAPVSPWAAQMFKAEVASDCALNDVRGPHARMAARALARSMYVF